MENFKIGLIFNNKIYSIDDKVKIDLTDNDYREGVISKISSEWHILVLEVHDDVLDKYYPLQIDFNNIDNIEIIK